MRMVMEQACAWVKGIQLPHRESSPGHPKLVLVQEGTQSGVEHGGTRPARCVSCMGDKGGVWDIPRSEARFIRSSYGQRLMRRSIRTPLVPEVTTAITASAGSNV